MSEVMLEEKNKDLIVPTLELNSIDDPVVNQLEEKDAEEFRKQGFSSDEIKQINEFAEKINLHDSNLIVTYGAGTQKKMSDFSDETLKQVRNKDLDEVGELLSGLMADLKHQPEEKKGIKGLFNKGANKLDSMRAYYGKVENSIDSVCESLEAHQQTLLKDIAIINQ